MEYSELIYAVEKDPVDLTHWKEYWREKYPRFLETEPLLKAEESKRELQRILKIELFRAVNKRWPNSVEEVPGFPKNIISEYPIRLKPVEQGLIVYRFSETAAESDLKALQEPSKIYINKGFLNPRALLYTKLLNPELRMK